MAADMQREDMPWLAPPLAVMLPDTEAATVLDRFMTAAVATARMVAVDAPATVAFPLSAV